jgi:hypothetical protein
MTAAPTPASPSPEEQKKQELPAHVLAARGWARKVFGAPGGIEKLVTDYSSDRITIVRIATQISGPGEAPRIEVRLEPTRDVARAYPKLLLPVFLEPAELPGLKETHMVNSTGEIPKKGMPLEDAELFRAYRPKLDPRVIASQQYLRFDVYAHWLAYETAGARGEVRQWGTEFEEPSSPMAAGPVRRRLKLWALASTLVFVTVPFVWFVSTTRSAYLAKTNFVLLGILGAAAFFFCMFLGGLLRAWSTKGMRRPRVLDILMLLFAVGTTAGMFTAKSTFAPKASDARDAIRDGNLALAERVIGAMQEVGGTEVECRALLEDIDYARTQKLSGDERLAKLELIAAQPGAHAAEATQEVRTIRIQKLNALANAGNAKELQRLLDTQFAGSSDDDILELRARAYDSEYEQCDNDACRYIAAQKASRAHASPARSSRVANLRGQLVSAMTYDDSLPETMLQRIKKLRSLEDKAKEISPLVKDDPDLLGRMSAITRKSADLREQAAILGVDFEIVKVLYPNLEGKDGRAFFSIEDAVVHFAFEKKVDVTSGLYVAPSTEAARKKGLSAQYRVMQLLQKAVGKPVTIPPPPGSDLVDVHWKENNVPLHARFLEKRLIELRVGEASASENLTLRPSALKPPPPKPAPVHAEIIAVPGGDLIIDGVFVGRDMHKARMAPGEHEIVVQNRFLGELKRTINVTEETSRYLVTW